MNRALLGGLAAAWAIVAPALLPAQAPPPTAAEAEQKARLLKLDGRTEFRVKYIGEGVVYLDGGRAAGLTEKMKLSVRRPAVAGAVTTPAISEQPPAFEAELEVESIAENSAVCEVKSSTAPLQKGDIAVLSAADVEVRQLVRATGAGRHYAQTITFSEGDPVDEEVREYQPRPPLPEVNRLRGRLGLDYNSIIDAGGSGASGQNVGVSFRADMTRLGGTYWNLSGYTRFRVNSQASSAQTTLTDLMNRTYHLSLTYDSPKSRWTLGLGRLYLPWAPSLSTIDGGYIGRRLNHRVTVGLFAGSAPDPSSWNYNPDRKLLGAFINSEGGSFEGLHYSSTSGLALSRLVWRPEREFLFFENSISWKQILSVYHDFEVDRVHVTTERPTASGTGIARSFLTVRLEPSKYVIFDLNQTYFRDFPTFDVRLIGTGLLDKYLFQGLSGGVRFNLPYHASVYTEIGRSSRSGDTKASLNQMYGVGVSDIVGTRIRGDFHFTRFDSNFGQGHYKSLSFSRQLRDTLRVTLLGGQQDFASPLSNQSRTRFITGSADWNFSAHYFLGAGLTVYRGGSQNYNQTYFTMGYRFR